MTAKSNPKPVLGLSDTETVKLDFDDTPFRKVKYWALWAKNRFKLGGFLILKSSEKCYHVVFDRAVSWKKNIQVMASVALLSHSAELQKYCLMQCIKKSSTLRVSGKREKPAPRIVSRFGKQDKQVKQFLDTRRIIKKIEKKCAKVVFFEGTARCF